MIIVTQQLIAILPLLIVGLAVLIVMLCIALRRNHFVNVIMTIIWLNLALLSLWCVIQNGPTDITPMIRVDRFSIFYTGLILISSLATIILAYAWLVKYPGNRDEFYLLVLIATIGGILLVNSSHLASLFIGIELISQPLFGMIGYTFQKKHSLEASIKYTLLSAAASSFLLFGMALVYADIGQLSFTDIKNTLKNTTLVQPLMLAGLGMMITGLGFKLSLVPFHLWTPDVYQGAPAPVSVFLATVSKIAIFVVVMRLFLYANLYNNKEVRLILEIIAFCSMIFGNLMPLTQNNIKRVLGYSSIAHLGYLLVGLLAILQAHALALETIGVYLFGYLLASLGAFGVISLLSSPYDNDKNANSLLFYRGLFWSKPILSAVLTVMMLSLAGIPMTLGFIGKFYLIILGIKSHMSWLTGAVIFSSSIGLFYYLRIIISLYLSPPKNLQHTSSFNWTLTAGDMIVLISSLLILILGIYPQPIIKLVQLAQPLL